MDLNVALIMCKMMVGICLSFSIGMIVAAFCDRAETPTAKRRTWRAEIRD